MWEQESRNCVLTDKRCTPETHTTFLVFCCTQQRHSYTQLNWLLKSLLHSNNNWAVSDAYNSTRQSRSDILAINLSTTSNRLMLHMHLMSSVALKGVVAACNQLHSQGLLQPTESCANNIFVFRRTWQDCIPYCIKYV